jgi:hypothetical protein
VRHSHYDYGRAGLGSSDSLIPQKCLPRLHIVCVDAVSEAQMSVSQGGVIHHENGVRVAKALPDAQVRARDEVVCKNHLQAHQPQKIEQQCVHGPTNASKRIQHHSLGHDQTPPLLQPSQQPCRLPQPTKECSHTIHALSCQPKVAAVATLAQHKLGQTKLPTCKPGRFLLLLNTPSVRNAWTRDCKVPRDTTAAAAAAGGQQEQILPSAQQLEYSYPCCSLDLITDLNSTPHARSLHTNTAKQTSTPCQ